MFSRGKEGWYYDRMTRDERIAWAVEHEDRIEWRDDPLRYPYLRQSVRTGYQWWGTIATPRAWATGIRVVGYAVLLPTASSRGTGQRTPVHRRYFWCKLADRDGSRIDPPAREAVDPRAIRPRVLTPWLFDSHDPEPRQEWLVNRRAELGLGPGMTVSS